jgi:putative flippase GtrA
MCPKINLGQSNKTRLSPGLIFCREFKFQSLRLDYVCNECIGYFRAKKVEILNRESNMIALTGKRSQKAFVQEIFGYSWVAALGLGVDIATLFVATEYFNSPYLFSAFLGFLTGLGVSFYLSEKFVFFGSMISNRPTRFMLFGIIGVVGLFILQVGMWIQVEFFDFDYLQAKVVCTVLVFLWNFSARRALYKK